MLGLVIFFQVYWPWRCTSNRRSRTLRRSGSPAWLRRPSSRRRAPAEGGQVAPRNPPGSTPKARRRPLSPGPRSGAVIHRGHGLDFPIVAEQSLPVLHAYAVPLAMASQRPRGNALLYDLQTGRLSPGVVAEGVVVREVEGLPAEFDGVLRDAERRLGFRPRVWALYPGDLYAVLRSLTEDTLKQQGVSVDPVQEARVRLSLAGGRAFTVTLVAHS